MHALGHAENIASTVARRPIDPALLERLTETGFLASEFGLHDHAERIFVLLARLRPANPSPVIALAMVRARAGLVDRAVLDLEELIAARPECDLARAMLGTMLVHAKRPGALALFQNVIQADADPAAVSISSSWLALAQENEPTTAAGIDTAPQLFRYHNIRP
jgi:hypothetical protein